MRIETKAKLMYLAETKALIKNALNEKGIAISDSDTFRSYADSIRNTEFQSPDVRYVTFMNGEETLYVKPVATGDDCVDVAAKGLIYTPKKESTVDKVFTYSGWAATDGGEVNANVLKAVTEDKTVYAAYTESVRMYTISFYDGDTLIESKQFAYGSTPVIETPTKDGYSFAYWEPTLAAVTGDTNYYAQWQEKTTFAGGSWADIAAISEAGQAQEYFKVGDTKTITVGDSSLNLILIGFDHDDLADGSGKAGMTIVATTALADTMPINDWATLASTMKSVLKPQLPIDLQSVIKPVIKQCDVATKNAVVTPTEVSFDLFPLSYNECKITAHGKRKSTDDDWETGVTTLGEPYQYFINKHNSTWRGPMNTFLHGTSNQFWMRQWMRFGSVQGLYSYTNLSTNSKSWCEPDTYTSSRKVMIAFCI